MVVVVDVVGSPATIAEDLEINRNSGIYFSFIVVKCELSTQQENRAHICTALISQDIYYSLPKIYHRVL